jgi:hypothetical protein
LEHQADGTPQRGESLGQHFRYRQQNRYMAIVPTRVMPTFLDGTVWLAAIGFDQWQSVHIRAQHHSPSRLCALQHAHHTGLTDARAHV